MKGIYWLVIITLLLISGLILVNKYYKPELEKNQYNVSISTEYNRKLIKTGLDVAGKIINTSTSYEILKLDEGLIKIKNINIENQNFYEEEIEVNVSSDMRIDLVLEKPEIPTIKVKDNGTITLILESENFKDIDFCLRGSYNYIFIKAKNFEEIKKLKEYENYDVCYDGGFSLNGNKKEIEISYTQFGQSNDNDYINITLIDVARNNITKTIK